MNAKVTIAKILSAVVSVVLCLATLPLLVAFAAYAGAKKLLDWIELYAVFKGDSARQDRAHWKG